MVNVENVQESVNAANGAASVPSITRKQAAENYGSWFSEESTPAELVCWCDARIAVYLKWVKNCKKLKAEMQKAVLNGVAVEDRLAGISKEELEKYLAAMA